jgi:hypothetical protein
MTLPPGYYPPAYPTQPAAAWPQAAAPQPQQPLRIAAPARPPVARGQMPEEPRRPVAPPAPTRLEMPSPEELGIAVAKPAAAVDWSAMHARLDRLGVLKFALEKLPTDGYRFTCLVPGADPNRPRPVEATAATEAEAVRRAVELAERGGP